MGQNENTSEAKRISRTRWSYIFRLILRCLILVFFVVLFFVRPEEFEILHGFNFFRRFSVLHVIWGLWMFDMILQLVPMRGMIALGSRKHYGISFRPIRERINRTVIRSHIKDLTRAAYRVFWIWVALLAVIGVLYFVGVLSKSMLFLISVVFFVCDLICVLIWCPFRLIMGNKCCTTCRIFNWDHLMMVTPMMFMGGFFALSLLISAIAVYLLWEICVMVHPERFSYMSNEALQCSQCTDKLCTQYCKKLRRR